MIPPMVTPSVGQKLPASGNSVGGVGVAVGDWAKGALVGWVVTVTGKGVRVAVGKGVVVGVDVGLRVAVGVGVDVGAGHWQYSSPGHLALTQRF